MPTWVKDKEKWNDAKKKVKEIRDKKFDEFTNRDWGLVTTIYKNMDGKIGTNEQIIQDIVKESFQLVEIEHFDSGSNRGQKLYTNLYIEHINKQTFVSLDLIKKYQTDVFIINFMIIDHMSHRIKDYNLIEEAIIAVDKNIGKLVLQYPEANYVIFSDHGSIRINHILFIYNWLE